MPPSDAPEATDARPGLADGGDTARTAVGKDSPNKLAFRDP